MIQRVRERTDLTDSMDRGREMQIYPKGKAESGFHN